MTIYDYPNTLRPTQPIDRCLYLEFLAKMKQEDRQKPIGFSCPCSRCRVYSM